jgi:alpha-1,2-mannosyltransferase
MGSASRPWSLWQRLLGVVVPALLLVIFAGPFLEDLRPERTHPVDFFQEWGSVRNYLAGQPVYLPQRETYLREIGSAPPPYLLASNAHPPTSVLLALPLGWLDYPDAVLAWNLLGLLALAVSVFLVVRGLGLRWSWWALLPLAAFLLLCDPFRQQVFQGQLNLVLGLFLTAAWYAGRRGATAWAGVWLGLATACKLFPGFLLVYALYRRQFRTVVAGVATTLLATVLTAALLGVGCYRTYVQEVLPGLEVYRGSGGNLSVIGFWAKLFNPTNTRDFQRPASEERDTDLTSLLPHDRILPPLRSPALARVLGLVSAAIVLLALAWAVRPGRRPFNFDLGFSLAMTAMLLVSPITWCHYFLLLLAPLAVLWTRLPAGGAARALFWASLFALWLNRNVVFENVIPGGHACGVVRPVHTVTVLSYQTYALLALFLLLLRAAARKKVVQPGRALASSSVIRLRSRSGIGALAPRS